jgi:hypothetical protein
MIDKLTNPIKSLKNDEKQTYFFVYCAHAVL